MNTIILIAASVISGQPHPLIEEAGLEKIVKDKRTFWYTKRSLPRVTQVEGSLFPQGYNMAAEPDPSGSPNNEHPWRHTGGLDNVGAGVQVWRLLWLPPGRRIVLYNERGIVPARGMLPYRRVAGVYPNGSVSAELMYDKGSMFEVRVRRKTEGSWSGEQYEHGPKPRGYVAVKNCTDCHKDVGRHAMAMDPRRDWYGAVSGMEKDGPIHWHPFDGDMVRRRGAAGSPVKFRQGIERFVKFDNRSFKLRIQK